MVSFAPGAPESSMWGLHKLEARYAYRTLGFLVIQLAPVAHGKRDRMKLVRLAKALFCPAGHQHVCDVYRGRRLLAVL